MWGSTATFFQLSGNWSAAIPLVENLSLTNTLFAGYTSGSNIPLHYHYYLGGQTRNPAFPIHQHPFMGYSAQQLRSTNLFGIRTELQFRFTNNTYIKGGWNAAHLSDSWSFDLSPDRMKYGYALSLGANTIIGPMELSLSTPNFSNDYALKIDIGYHF